MSYRVSYRTALIGLSWIAADPAGPASDPVLGTAVPFSHASAMAAIPEIAVEGSLRQPMGRPLAGAPRL